MPRFIAQRPYNGTKARSTSKETRKAPRTTFHGDIRFYRYDDNVRPISLNFAKIRSYKVSRC